MYVSQEYEDQHQEEGIPARSNRQQALFFYEGVSFRYYTGVKTEGGSYREQSVNISFYVWGVAIWNNFVKDLLKTKGAL